MALHFKRLCLTSTRLPGLARPLLSCGLEPTALPNGNHFRAPSVRMSPLH